MLATLRLSRIGGARRSCRLFPTGRVVETLPPRFCLPRTRARHQSTTPATSSTLFHPNNNNNNNNNHINIDSYSRPFDKILIANRGEIACRIIRTCRRLGIRTVAVYSVADGPQALHAQMADEAYLLGTGPTPAESYLRIDEILHVAMTSGAQAIHPGYGFVSENANLAQLIQDQYAPYLCLVGPSASAMRAMGSKSHAKSLMEAAGVPTTPGYHPKSNSGDDDASNNADIPQDAMFLKQQAVEHIGFPLLIKAVMGGGGKGMRLVWNESDFLSALESCQRESLTAFGNSQVILEKYLVRPRHVEVQVLADSHGNTLHLYERDCSLQRRHQKVLEEAPASDLPWELRQTLGNMATRAAQAVNYVNAGTVEFLLDTQQQHNGDNSEKSENIPFYFCEMNTRLQVEHPVTESITGLDVVEWQLRVAAGQALPWSQEDIPCRGHAFEARIYAEQPTRQFLPATGRIWHHRPPVDLINQPVNQSGVRVDTGLVAGQEISVFYDPMISKLIVHGETRQEALTKLVTALQQYQIAGVPNNLDFLIQCAQHSVVQQAGAVTTGFLDEHGDEIIQVLTATNETPTDIRVKVIGAFVAVLHQQGRVDVQNIVQERRRSQPWSSWSGSWRMGGVSGLARQVLKCRIMTSGMEAPTQDVQYVCHRDGSMDIGVATAGENEKGEGTEWYHVDGSVNSDGQVNAVVNRTHRFHLSLALRNKSDNEGNVELYLWSESLVDSTDIRCAWHLEYDTQRRRNIQDGTVGVAGGSGNILRAPMPGKITRLPFDVGTHVDPGDVVIVMEAMKMEHAIKATRSGIVSSLTYRLNEVVPDGAILAVIEDEKENAAQQSHPELGSLAKAR